jgi:aminopeptidase N
MRKNTSLLALVCLLIPAAAWSERLSLAAVPEHYALTLAPDLQGGLLRDTFEYAMSPRVRTQDASLLISRLLANPVGRTTVWPLIQQRWDRLSTTFGALGGTGRIVEALGHFCSRESARQIDRFFDLQPAAGAQRTLEQSIDRIQRCAAVVEARADDLREALETQQPLEQ